MLLSLGSRSHRLNLRSSRYSENDIGETHWKSPPVCGVHAASGPSRRGTWRGILFLSIRSLSSQDPGRTGDQIDHHSALTATPTDEVGRSSAGLDTKDKRTCRGVRTPMRQTGPRPATLNHRFVPKVVTFHGTNRNQSKAKQQQHGRMPRRWISDFFFKYQYLRAHPPAMNSRRCLSDQLLFVSKVTTFGSRTFCGLRAANGSDSAASPCFQPRSATIISCCFNWVFFRNRVAQ